MKATTTTARVLTVIAACAALGAPPALANDWAGSDPANNFAVGPVPMSCYSQPQSAACIDIAVGYLDQARASLGQPPYQLPTNFDSLTPAEQALVLTDLDRSLYGLPAIPGLTDSLSADAASAVEADSDPMPSTASYYAFTGNWAGGFLNMPLAYEAWMYDDGPGSGNLDCTAVGTSGCWGHRHDVLWRFNDGGSTAMGAAAGADPSGNLGFAMLLFEGDGSYQPSYTYTWSEAIAGGAGGPGVSTGTPTGSGSRSGTTPRKGSPSGSRSGAAHQPAHSASRVGPRLHVRRVRVRGHRIAVSIAAPTGAELQCTLIHSGHRASTTLRWRGCAHRTVTFRDVAAGSYRFQARSATQSISRSIRVR